jgi:hypothetical protein
MGEANTARHEFKDGCPANWQNVDQQTALWLQILRTAPQRIQEWFR